MTSKILQYLLLLAITIAILPFACAKIQLQMCGFVDYFLATPSFKESTVKAKKLCFSLCLSHPDCKTTNYILGRHLCALNNISHLDSSQQLMIVPGSFYAFNEALSDCSIMPTSAEATSSIADSSWVWKEEEFSVVGKQSTQSSTHFHWFSAGRANDGSTGILLETNPYCAHTKDESHPWWRVDLGGEHWLGIITVVNRGDSKGHRLAGATVRAGLSQEFTNNKICGCPVSQDQAQDGAWIEFICDPRTLASCVSVDINAKSPKPLQLCEVMIREYVAEETKK